MSWLLLALYPRIPLWIRTNSFYRGNKFCPPPSKTLNMRNSIANDDLTVIRTRPVSPCFPKPLLSQEPFGGCVWRFYFQCSWWPFLSIFCSPGTFSYHHFQVLDLPNEARSLSRSDNIRREAKLMPIRYELIFGVFFSPKSQQQDPARECPWCISLFILLRFCS